MRIELLNPAREKSAELKMPPRDKVNQKKKIGIAIARNEACTDGTWMGGTPS